MDRLSVEPVTKRSAAASSEVSSFEANSEDGSADLGRPKIPGATDSSEADTAQSAEGLKATASAKET